MSHRNNTVVLSSTSLEEISNVLYMIKNTEQGIKSIVFQENAGILKIGRSRVNVPLPTNLSFQLISTIELNNLKLEIENLKVN
jgi:predicted aconitase with swiveling domain